MYKQLIAILACTFTFLTPSVWATTQSEKIEEIVTILTENPEIIDGLHQNLAVYVKQQQQFSTLLKSSQNYLSSTKHTYLGAEQGETTILNVTDYSCPFCKKLDVELAKLVENYPNIKVININVPLKEGNDSISSAAYALNVWQHDREKYQQVHELLVAKPGAHNIVSLTKVAQKTRTTQYLKLEDDIKQQLDNNYTLFTNLGLRGTPALIINETIVPGYLPYEQLEQLVEDSR